MDLTIRERELFSLKGGPKLMGEVRRRSSPDLDNILDKLRDVKPCGKGWSARCPAHNDHHPSLTVTEVDSGLIMMFCHAGCSHEDICRALNQQHRRDQ
jgi:hypothetical protein